MTQNFVAAVPCINDTLYRETRCTSISRTGSSSVCAKRHRCLQPVHAVRHSLAIHWPEQQL